MAAVLTYILYALVSVPVVGFACSAVAVQGWKWFLFETGIVSFCPTVLVMWGISLTARLIVGMSVKADGGDKELQDYIIADAVSLFVIFLVFVLMAIIHSFI